MKTIDLAVQSAQFGGSRFSERFYVYRHNTSAASYVSFEVYAFGRCYLLSVKL